MSENMNDYLLSDDFINRLVKREKAAFQLLFDAFYRSLCFFATKIIHDPNAVEDIVQDVFITLLEKKMLFQSEVHLKNFLYLSIRNSCLNYIRSTRSKDRYIASLAYEEQAENFEESIILTEIHRELAAAVEKLPEECRKVFQLCYFQGLDNESAAQELGLSVNTVKAQKARGKKILKENLKDIFPLLMLLNPLF